MRLIKLAMLFILVMPGICLSGEPASQNDESSYSNDQNNGQNKRETLREVALNWIDVGTELAKRGLYEQAEEAFLSAGQYQEYLSAQEHKRLKDQIDKNSSAIVERKAVSENIQQAKDLIDKGQPVMARAVYEKIRNSPYLTEAERQQIADELKTIDTAFDKQKKEVTDLYNRSIELYRAGDLERAREGFAEVAKSGLLVTPEGHSPQDYLLQIDNILTAKMKPEISEKPALLQPNPSEEITPGPPVVSENADDDSINEMDLLKPGSSVQEDEEQNQNREQEIAEVTSAAEPSPVTEKPQSQQEKARAKEKIIRTYTRAVVESAETRVEAYIDEGEFTKAITVIHNAANVVRNNRPIIGDELFVQYSSRLKMLTERIIEAGKTN